MKIGNKEYTVNQASNLKRYMVMKDSIVIVGRGHVMETRTPLVINGILKLFGGVKTC
jgi:hypothetical protein